MKRFGILAVITLLLTLPLISCEQNYLKVVDSNIKKGTINLNDLSKDIIIPTSASIVKIGRGDYTYTLKRKKTLRYKEYVVNYTDMLSFTSAHQAAPEDAYSRTLEVVEGTDARAVDAIFSFQTGKVEIKTSADKRNAEQMIANVNHLNHVKFPIAILPADSYVRKKSKRINNKDSIFLSGVQYSIINITKNGSSQPIPRCLSSDIIYTTELDIK